MPAGDEAPLRVVAILANLRVIRDYVEAVARRAGFPETTVHDLVLAVDEAATNIIVHGYEQGGPESEARGVAGLIEVDARHEEPIVRVTLRDHARAFDPTAVRVASELPPLADRLPGGLGIFLIRKTMDEIHYRRTPDGWNELTLVVARRPARSAED